MRGLSFLIFLLSFEAFSSQCIAHRGNNEQFLENSLAALKSAIDLGAHGIEFDLNHTKDGVALLMHDKKLRRVSKDLPGKSCPLKTKIKKLDLKTIKENCQLKNGEPIPTLEEAFELIGNYPGHLFIELKDSPSYETLELIARMRTGKEDKTRFISFKRRYLKKAKKLTEKFPLYGEIKMLNINVFWPFAGRNLGLDVGKWGQSLLFWARWWKKEIGVWTIDKIELMKKLMAKKIPYITTNRVIACMELTKSNE